MIPTNPKDALALLDAIAQQHVGTRNDHLAAQAAVAILAKAIAPPANESASEATDLPDTGGPADGGKNAK